MVDAYMENFFTVKQDLSILNITIVLMVRGMALELRDILHRKPFLAKN